MIWNTLIGVLLGGIIASIAPMTQLFFEHRRWKLEKRIEVLRIERKHYEELYDEILPEIEKGLAEQSWNMKGAAITYAAVPEVVTKELFEFIRGDDKSEDKIRSVYFSTVTAMKRHLSEIDDEIKKVINDA